LQDNRTEHNTGPLGIVQVGTTQRNPVNQLPIGRDLHFMKAIIITTTINGEYTLITLFLY
jgi:hypothetical protein